MGTARFASRSSSSGSTRSRSSSSGSTRSRSSSSLHSHLADGSTFAQPSHETRFRKGLKELEYALQG